MSLEELESLGPLAFVRLNKAKLHAINGLRHEDEFCDLTLITGDKKEIKVHKVVLSVASNYFKDLLSSGMQECRTGKIKLRDITGNILEKIISFIYVGTDNFDFDNIDDIAQIIKHSTYFQLHTLTELCVSILLRNFNDNNCINFWRLSVNCLVDKLEDHCFAYVVSNANRLVRKPSFLFELTEHELKIILGSDILPCSPELIFEFTSEWAKNATNTIEDFINLLSKFLHYFEFPRMSKEFILEKILSNEDFMEDKRILRVIGECVKQIWKEEQDAAKRAKLKILNICEKRKRFLVLCGPEILEVRDDGILKVCSKTKFDRVNYACTAFNNNLFVCGGSCPELSSRNGSGCEYFSLQKKQWISLPEMYTERIGHSCINVSKWIYVCGGADNPKSIEKFNLDEQIWTGGPDMNEERFGFGLAYSQSCGSIYAAGGRKSSRIEKWDPRDSSGWQLILGDLDGYKQYTKCIIVDYCLYCFSSTQESIFDIRNEKFISIRDLHLSGEYVDACYINNEIGIISYDKSNDEDKSFLKLFKTKPKEFIMIDKIYELQGRWEYPALTSLYY